MQLRVYKRVYLTPFVRINLFTQGFSISVGHSRIGWITFGRRGIRETVSTPLPGVYLSENQRWGQLTKLLPRRQKLTK
jgi:hypothetical protein